MSTSKPDTHPLTLDDFDFHLPHELIAQQPNPRRSGARLLDASQEAVVDRVFSALPSLLRPDDLLVFNDTKVIPARLFGSKPSGGKIELLIERILGHNEVAAQLRANRKPAVGSTFALSPAASSQDCPRATLLGRWPDAQGALFRLALNNDLLDDPLTLIQRHGHMPLPPYIRHSDAEQDRLRYQTVFASQPGAVAAPTAGLHFDHDLLAQIDALGVQRRHITLHVGAGTFQPITHHDLSQHRMHSEWYQVPDATAQAIRDCQARGGRLLAVGTTTVRALESWAQTGRSSGETRIFIQPGFKFQLTQALITNFHLPKSSLLLLVGAFVGHARMQALYAHAIANRYRFFSYGDAMLLARASN